MDKNRLAIIVMDNADDIDSLCFTVMSMVGPTLDNKGAPGSVALDKVVANHEALVSSIGTIMWPVMDRTLLFT